MQRSRGYAVLVFLIIISLAMLYSVVSQLNGASVKSGSGAATGDALAQAREALLAYAATYRDVVNGNEVFGYLPCPDMTAVATGTQGNGAAESTCGSPGEIAVGLLPYRTLGLEQLRDDAGVCLWYVVSGGFKNNPKAASPMNWDTQGQLAISGANGEALAAPNDAYGGAAAIVIATGMPVTGQSRSSTAGNNCGIVPSEVAQYLDGNYAFATTGTVTVTQGIARDGNGVVTNNDRLTWITPKDIFDKVLKRADFYNPTTASPVGQINKLSDEIRAVLEKRIQDDLVAGGTPSSSQPANSTSYPSSVGTVIGDLPVTLSLNAPSYANYYSSWQEQYRTAICASLVSGCLTVPSSASGCRGALMLGGRMAAGQNGTASISGQPRTTGQKLSGASTLGYFYESSGALGIASGSSTNFSGNTSFQAINPSDDTVTCLFPGAFVSFAQNIGSFTTGIVSASGGAPVSVSTANKTITLGSSSSSIPRSGCDWYPTPLPLTSMLRLYFRYQVVTRGPGFTLTVADAATNSLTNTSPVMCGGTGSALLGYASAPPSGMVTRSGGSTVPILSVSWSGTSLGSCAASSFRATVSVESAPAIPFFAGESLSLSNVDPSGYNGPQTIESVASSTQFRFCLSSNPGLPQAGIKAPKLGIEFDTRQNAAQLDPSSDHFAFLYWGGATDSNPTGTGADDNTHYAGILGSGAEPLNPRATTSPAPTATSIAPVMAVTWLGGIATATTHGPHGFAAGQYAYISDVTSTGFESATPFLLTTVPDDTHFTYLLPINPGTYAYGTDASRTAKALGMSSGVVTTVHPHGFSAGQYVNVSGFTGSPGCNGLYQIASIGSSTQFTLASNSSSCTSTGYITATHTITAASWNGGTVTITTNGAHGLSTGQYVHIANIFPEGYNGTYAIITTSDPSQFTYSLALDPGGPYSSSSTPGITTVSSLRPIYFSGSGSTVPLNTQAVPYDADTQQSGVIHVRVDIARSYDPTTHRATLNMKAYIADTIPGCFVSDFKNLSLELADICPSLSPTIEQVGIPINDVSGPALSNAYVGFTTSRTGAIGTNQEVVVSNLLLRSQ